ITKSKHAFLMAQIGQNGKRQAATACLLVRWCHSLVR
ncbi:phage tail fiber repeat protein, partial [Haemophilus influenzae]